MNNKPSWVESFDFDDNSMWIASSPYTDSDGGSEFEWRLKQRLVKNKIEWYEDSDVELMADPDNPRTWESLKEAKIDIERGHTEIIEDIETQK